MKRLNTLILALGFTLTIQAQAYMDSDQPNASKMLPAPPDTKSLGFVNDLTLYRWGKSAREESAGKLAYNFIMWDFDGFLRSLSKAVNKTINASNTPKLYALLEYADKYATKVITATQGSIMRERPFKMFKESSYVRSMESRYADISSYPCEQALRGWLYSLLLAEVCPDSDENIYTRGLKYGPSMVIAGYNYESDVHAGHQLGSALLARMHCHGDFKELLDAAKQEMGTSRSRALTRASDEPYLSLGDLPNSDEYLPEPPQDLSSQMSCDIVSYNEGKLFRQQDEGKQAVADVTYSADNFCVIFSKVLGHEISASKTPAIYELLQRVHPSGNAATQKAKAAFRRQRPYVYMDEPTSYPDDEAGLYDTGSYPSGHASGSWLMGLVLSEVTRSHQDEILARAYEYGQGRVITGYHWQSDVNYGRVVGSAVYATLHGEKAFLDQMSKAVQEYDRIYGGTSAIRAVSAEAIDTPVYNLQGQRVDMPSRGIFIQNHKKVIR